MVPIVTKLFGQYATLDLYRGKRFNKARAICFSCSSVITPKIRPKSTPRPSVVLSHSLSSALCSFRDELEKIFTYSSLVQNYYESNCADPYFIDSFLNAQLFAGTILFIRLYLKHFP